LIGPHGDEGKEGRKGKGRGKEGKEKGRNGGQINNTPEKNFWLRSCQYVYTFSNKRSMRLRRCRKTECRMNSDIRLWRASHTNLYSRACVPRNID